MNTVWRLWKGLVCFHMCTCACVYVGVHVCVHARFPSSDLHTLPRTTYIADEAGNVSRAGGQHPVRLGGHVAKGSISTQRRPSQGQAQRRQFCWVAQLVYVVGIL